MLIDKKTCKTREYQRFCGGRASVRKCVVSQSGYQKSVCCSGFLAFFFKNRPSRRSRLPKYKTRTFHIGNSSGKTALLHKKKYQECPSQISSLVFAAPETLDF